MDILVIVKRGEEIGDFLARGVGDLREILGDIANLGRDDVPARGLERLGNRVEFLDLRQGDSVSVDVTATDSGTPRQMLTRAIVIIVTANPHPWNYVPQSVDSNGDGHVVPNDALLLINQLNSPSILETNGRLPSTRPANSTVAYYDVNGDGFLTTNDVLRIINFLNANSGEGEPSRRGMTSVWDGPSTNLRIVMAAREIDRSQPLITDNRLTSREPELFSPNLVSLPTSPLNRPGSRSHRLQNPGGKQNRGKNQWLAGIFQRPGFPADPQELVLL